MILLLLIPLVLASSVAARSASADVRADAAAPKAQVLVVPQIVGGTNVSSIEQLPWHVRFTFNFGSNTSTSACGGSIIDDDWILTAAHCVVNKEGKKPDWATLMFGATYSTDFQANKLVVTVGGANIIVHEEYSSTDALNDVALVKLNIPLPISKNNKRIVVIKLPKSTDKRDFAGSKVSVSGWGRTNDTEKASPTLKWANTTVLSQDDCVNQAPSSAKIVPQYICISTKAGIGDQPCNGDSGGPLSFREKNGNPVHLGVASFVYGCSRGLPSIYARTSFFLPWIASKTGLKF